MPVSFTANEINQASAVYQKEYREKALAGVENYLKWLNANVLYKGVIRKTPFHIYHGAKGGMRAEALKLKLNNPKIDFYNLVDSVGSDLLKSGLTTHSLKRFMFESMTGIIVTQGHPHTKAGDFESAAYGAAVEDLERLKSAFPNGSTADVEEKGLATQPILTGDKLNFWSITIILQTLAQEPVHDVHGNLSTFEDMHAFADHLLRIYRPYAKEKSEQDVMRETLISPSHDLPPPSEVMSTSTRRI